MKKALKKSLLKIDSEDFDIFIPTKNDDDEMLRIKNNFNKLEQYEKNLFIIYMNSNSNINAVAELFNISWLTMNKYITNIREKLLC